MEKLTVRVRGALLALLSDAGPEMIAELRAAFSEAADQGCLVDAIMRCMPGYGGR